MAQIPLSARAQSMPVSTIRNAIPPQENVRVYKLNIGQPDLPSPKEFFDGLSKFSSSVIAYDSARGNKSLIAAWSALLNTLYSLSLTEQNFLITAGSSEALTFAFNICCDVEDEILVFSPTYANYTGFARMAGVKLVAVPCSFHTNFHTPVNAKEIEKHLTPKTKAILICNPNNPTGSVFTQQELTTLHELCVSKNIFLFVDEVYREFIYTGEKPSTVLAQFPNSKHVVVFDSLSKRYSLCGARIGCLITHNQAFMQAAINFASTRVSTATIEQAAAAHMLTHIPDTYLTNAINEYHTRRNTLAAALVTVPGIGVTVPEGGFYVYASLPVEDAVHFTQFMEYSFSYNQETLSISPAKEFLINQKEPSNYVRIAFVLSKPELTKSVTILRHALKAYNKL